MVDQVCASDIYRLLITLLLNVRWYHLRSVVHSFDVYMSSFLVDVHVCGQASMLRGL